MRYRLPQPYQELPHTADLGLSTRGRSPEETLARLVLALAGLLSGGGGVAPGGEEVLLVREGADLARTAVGVLREVLFRFAARREIPWGCEVRSLAAGRAELVVGFGPYRPELHGEGRDVKAVTYHRARFEPDGGSWIAEVYLDV